MVNSCAAYNCTNRRVKGSGVKFHLFPLKNRELCEKWVVAIKRDNFVPTENSYLCGDHFNASDYKYIDSNKLKDAAVPSKFAFPGHLQKNEQIRKLPAKRKHDVACERKESESSTSANVNSNSPSKQELKQKIVDKKRR